MKWRFLRLGPGKLYFDRKVLICRKRLRELDVFLRIQRNSREILEFRPTLLIRICAHHSHVNGSMMTEVDSVEIVGGIGRDGPSGYR